MIVTFDPFLVWWVAPAAYLVAGRLSVWVFGVPFKTDWVEDDMTLNDLPPEVANFLGGLFNFLTHYVFWPVVVAVFLLRPLGRLLGVASGAER